MNGSGTLVTQLFIQAGFAWFLLCGLLFGLTFLIGWKRGGVPAYRYKRNLTWLWLAVTALIAGYGWISGEMGQFINGWGVWSLFDMVGLGLGWVGTMWWMATSYSNSRMFSDHEARFATLADDVCAEQNIDQGEGA